MHDEIHQRYATLQLPGALHVNSAQTHEAAGLAGLGLIQAPLLGIGRYLESGALVEIISDFRRRALAVSLVVAHRSNLPRRVRAFMKWIENVLAPYLEQRSEPLLRGWASFAERSSPLTLLMRAIWHSDRLRYSGSLMTAVRIKR
jgi:LysR substrate binding domain